jgi:CRP/FNR family cyclic AMP-dependent transcriptional regulator
LEGPAISKDKKLSLKSSAKLEPSAKALLDAAGVPRRIRKFKITDVIYSQGDAANSVMYLEQGRVKLSVTNEVGKNIVVATIGPGDFFGEGSLAGQRLRIGSAMAIAPCIVLVVEKNKMLQAMHDHQAISDRFITFMLARNIRIERHLVDHLFISIEKRLARTLLLLARYGKEEGPHGLIPNVSSETLAQLVGTTTPQVESFMDNFKKLGFIKYDDGLRVDASLLGVVFRD